MRKLFLLLSLNVGDPMYLSATRRLIDEILRQTTHDILVTTNELSFFADVDNPRVKVRNNVPPNIVLRYQTEFNYNAKYLCFKDVPTDYDALIYLDGDIRIDGYTEASDAYIDELLTHHEMAASRTNAIMRDELHYHKTAHCTFSHKFIIYEYILSLPESDPVMEAQLPSEHFLIFKNIPEKIKAFGDKWDALDKILQEKNQFGGYSSCCDGFEIGIAANHAGFKMQEITNADSQIVLGMHFNGNKY
jgi:hypothetical protein